MAEQNAFELGGLTGWKLVGAPLVMMWSLNIVIRYFFPQQPDFQEKRVVFSSVALKRGVTASCKCYPSSAPLLPHVKAVFLVFFKAHWIWFYRPSRGHINQKRILK